MTRTMTKRRIDLHYYKVTQQIKDMTIEEKEEFMRTKVPQKPMTRLGKDAQGYGIVEMSTDWGETREPMKK